MFDYDAIIVGGGPAGLTASMYLARASYRVLLLDKESFGGQLKNVYLIENYPGFSEGISGPKLASEMVNQAGKFGVELEIKEVVGVEPYSSCTLVNCADGKGYTCGAVVIAGGARPRRLGVPGEERLQGRGIVHCALCDGGRFTDCVVAVCGGGDSGVSEALYMRNIASRVILLEAEPGLTATAILRERVRHDSKLEVRCGKKVVEILGGDNVTGIEVIEAASGQREMIKVDGVIVHVGIEPNTDYLEDVISLDDQKRIIVDDRLVTQIASITAAGDIRKGSPWQIGAAVGDGVMAALSAQRFLNGSNK
ncbi:MAG: FAD-dependent oxidoreductase [Deltaproteobacteria bacterium]|nr:FAD-dependent oxidoreductase [Deltaproteobacteria bacterium]